VRVIAPLQPPILVQNDMWNIHLTARMITIMSLQVFPQSEDLLIQCLVCTVSSIGVLAGTGDKKLDESRSATSACDVHHRPFCVLCVVVLAQ
jgi:hypothetical protein